MLSPSCWILSCWIWPSRLPACARYFTFLGQQSHDAAAGGIHGHRVVAQYQHSGVFGFSLKRTVPFHSDDAVDDCESPAAQRR